MDSIERDPTREAPVLSDALGDEVRSLLAATESAADTIRRDAEEDAEEIRRDAARRAREDVTELTGESLRRLEERAGELGALLEDLRADASRLATQLAQIQGVPTPEPHDPTPRPEPPRPDPRPEPAPPADPVPPADPTPDPASGRPPRVPVNGETDYDELKRGHMIALNMAINGARRDETERYLAENLEITDRRGLLDAVYGFLDR